MEAVKLEGIPNIANCTLRIHTDTDGLVFKIFSKYIPAKPERMHAETEAKSPERNRKLPLANYQLF